MKQSRIVALGGAAAALMCVAATATVTTVYAETRAQAPQVSVPAIDEYDQLSPDLAMSLAKVLAVSASEDNIGGEYFDRENQTFTVYVVGKPSHSMLSITEEVSQHLRVEFAEAAATKGEMAAATVELIQIDGVAGVFQAPDGSGLRVDVVGAASKVQREVRNVSNDVPITVDVHDETPVEFSDTRPDDYAPFNGGSRIYIQGASGCSMGLPVRRKNNNNIGLLTAAHCSDNGNGWGQSGLAVRTYHGSRLVATTRDHTALKWDAQFTRADTSYGTNIFIGNHLSGSKRGHAPEYRRYVAGDNLRVSGGYSGVNVGKVIGSYTPNYGPAGVSMGSMYLLESTNGVAISGHGDSGSPVFELYNGTAVAAGLNSGLMRGQYEAPCTGVPTDPSSNGRKCSTRVIVSPWCNIKSALNLDVHASGSFMYPVDPKYLKC